MQVIGAAERRPRPRSRPAEQAGDRVACASHGSRLRPGHALEEDCTTSDCWDSRAARWRAIASRCAAICSRCATRQFENSSASAVGKQQAPQAQRWSQPLAPTAVWGAPPQAAAAGARLARDLLLDLGHTVQVQLVSAVLRAAQHHATAGRAASSLPSKSCARSAGGRGASDREHRHAQGRGHRADAAGRPRAGKARLRAVRPVGRSVLLHRKVCPSQLRVVGPPRDAGARARNGARIKQRVASDAPRVRRSTRGRQNRCRPERQQAPNRASSPPPPSALSKFAQLASAQETKAMQGVPRIRNAPGRRPAPQ